MTTIEEEEKAQIYLVDDHPLMRDSLTSLLNEQRDIAVCGESDDASHAIREMSSLQPDLAIIDISLRESSGLDLVKAARDRIPRTYILVLSMHDEKLYAERCIRAGAHGYMMKSESAKTIVDSVRKILAGKTCISERIAGVLAERVFGRRKTGDGSPSSEFSDRELEVFDLLGQGLGSRQIAASLNISIKTVQTYLWRIRQKLCLSSATELMRNATLWRDQNTNGTPV